MWGENTIKVKALALSAHALYLHQVESSGVGQKMTAVMCYLQMLDVESSGD
jgi:hypothetical protein